MLCRYCLAQLVRRCSNHRESKCVPCASRYRRLLARVAEDGSRFSGGYSYLLTLNAPGENDHHQWDPDWRRGSRPECSCHVGVVLEEWNPSAAGRWNRLRTALKREHAGLEYLRAVEVQTRGALHLHVMVWSPTPLDVLQVQGLAMAAGFGCVLDLQELPQDHRRAARYVAKYVTKAVDSREAVPWLADVVDEETGEITRELVVATFRSWSSSRGWLVTMKAVKESCAASRRAAAIHLAQLVVHELESATPLPLAGVAGTG